MMHWKLIFAIAHYMDYIRRFNLKSFSVQDETLNPKQECSRQLYRGVRYLVKSMDG